MLGFIAAALMYVNMHAQDFYNGFRGPKATQIDLHASRTDGKYSGMVIPKLFTKNLDDSLIDLVVAVPNSISDDGQVENQGLNLGYICEMKDASIIGALGLFKNESGRYRMVTPQIYATLINGPWTFDIESNYSIGASSNSSSASATAGYGLSKYVRIGGGVTFKEGKAPSYMGDIRIELAEDHRYWLQGYITKESIDARLAINL